MIHHRLIMGKIAYDTFNSTSCTSCAVRTAEGDRLRFRWLGIHWFVSFLQFQPFWHTRMSNGKMNRSAHETHSVG